MGHNYICHNYIEQVAAETLAAMESIYGFKASTNVEIAFRSFLLSLKSKDMSCTTCLYSHGLFSYGLYSYGQGKGHELYHMSV